MYSALLSRRRTTRPGSPAWAFASAFRWLAHPRLQARSARRRSAASRPSAASGRCRASRPPSARPASPSARRPAWRTSPGRGPPPAAFPSGTSGSTSSSSGRTVVAYSVANGSGAGSAATRDRGPVTSPAAPTRARTANRQMRPERELGMSLRSRGVGPSVSETRAGVARGGRPNQAGVVPSVAQVSEPVRERQAQVRKPVPRTGRHRCPIRRSPSPIRRSRPGPASIASPR